MKLIIQPGDSIDRIVKAIRKAQKSVEIMIFRFDRPEIERALADAAERGIMIHALIAFTNRGGEDGLRKLEMRFLESGITVARTAGDLVRYHGKMMIVDRKEVFLLSFNFTHLDIEHSRSFGVITRNPKVVAEAVRLFEADTKRQVDAAAAAKRPLDDNAKADVELRRQKEQGADQEKRLADESARHAAELKRMQEERLAAQKAEEAKRQQDERAAG